MVVWKQYIYRNNNYKPFESLGILIHIGRLFQIYECYCKNLHETNICLIVNVPLVTKFKS